MNFFCDFFFLTNILTFRSALSCKQGYEFSNVKISPKLPNWFCHFDDDTFVNFRNLKETLKSYDPENDHYLGKRSISNPIKIRYNLDFGNYENMKISKPFVFGTGGAGWCLSKSVLEKVMLLIE